jgi:hypothetical protein
LLSTAYWALGLMGAWAWAEKVNADKAMAKAKGKYLFFMA